MIYFIRDSFSGRIKIGTAGDPWKRLAKIQSDCPGDATLLAMEPGGVEREQELHAFFATERRRGEWFLPSPRLNAHIAQLGAPDRPPVNMKTRGFWNGMSSAEVMRATGISKGHLSKIRSDRRGCSPEMAIRIQEVTGLSAIRLVFGDLADKAA